MKNLAVTLAGSGSIGRVHMAAYTGIPFCYAQADPLARLDTLVTSRPGSACAGAFRRAVGGVEEAEPTDVADICTPNFTHGPLVRALLKKGFRSIYCEKPLTGFYAEEAELARRAEQEGVLNQVALVYRFLPALVRARYAVQNGAIGELLHFSCTLYHGSYLDPGRPMSWRLRRSKSGGGALVDLGIHALDALTFAAGPVAEAEGFVRTFIKTRPDENGAPCEVDVDDFAHIDARIGDACGFVEVSRVAAGASGDLELLLCGTKGSLRVVSSRPDYPAACLPLQGERGKAGGLSCAALDAEVAEVWPAAKQSLGIMENMHMASAYCFLKRACGAHFTYLQPPLFADSAKAMAVIDGIYSNGKYRAPV